MTRHDPSSSCQPEQLLLYHYGELERVDRLQVEHHLQHCRACHSELTELQTILKTVPTTAPELSPRELQRFNARVLERVQPRRSWFSWPVLAWALAGTAVVLIAVNLRQQTLTHGPEPTRVPLQMAAEQKMLPDLEFLQNLELLENLDLIQQLETLG